MVKVKSRAKVITIVPAQDAYGNISLVKPVFKVITIEPPENTLSVCALKRFRGRRRLWVGAFWIEI